MLSHHLLCSSLLPRSLHPSTSVRHVSSLLPETGGGFHRSHTCLVVFTRLPSPPSLANGGDCLPVPPLPATAGVAGWRSRARVPLLFCPSCPPPPLLSLPSWTEAGRPVSNVFIGLDVFERSATCYIGVFFVLTVGEGERGWHGTAQDAPPRPRPHRYPDFQFPSATVTGPDARPAVRNRADFCPPQPRWQRLSSRSLVPATAEVAGRLPVGLVPGRGG